MRKDETHVSAAVQDTRLTLQDAFRIAQDASGRFRLSQSQARASKNLSTTFVHQARHGIGFSLNARRVGEKGRSSRPTTRDLCYSFAGKLLDARICCGSRLCKGLVRSP